MQSETKIPYIIVRPNNSAAVSYDDNNALDIPPEKVILNWSSSVKHVIDGEIRSTDFRLRDDQIAFLTEYIYADLGFLERLGEIVYDAVVDAASELNVELEEDES